MLCEIPLKPGVDSWPVDCPGLVDGALGTEGVGEHVMPRKFSKLLISSD